MSFLPPNHHCQNTHCKCLFTSVHTLCSNSSRLNITSTSRRPTSLFTLFSFLSSYIQPRMLINPLVLSRCQIPICSLFRLFTLYLSSAASALQLLKPGTLSLQLFVCVLQPRHFLSSSQDSPFPAGLPICLTPSFLHLRFGFC